MSSTTRLFLLFMSVVTRAVILVGTTTVPGGGGGGGTCQNTWVIYNSSHSVGATKTLNPMLLADCLNRCATDTQCVAVDFNSASNPVECWVHTNLANINVRYADPTLTQYVISSRCPTSPAPPNPGKITKAKVKLKLKFKLELRVCYAKLKPNVRQYNYYVFFH